jgi:hypothetical protein
LYCTHLYVTCLRAVHVSRVLEHHAVG